MSTTLKKAGARLFAILVTLSLGATLAASCGSETSDTPPDDNNCSLGGQKCAFGCSDSLGCVDCLSDSDCGARSCVQGRCEDCAVSTDCGAGQACFPGSFTCETACTGNADCDNGNANICETNSGACVECLTDTDCPQDNPICDPVRKECGECAADIDCPQTDPVCDLQNGECRECLVDDHCPSGTLCGTDHKCHNACTTDVDCTNPERPVCNLDNNDCVQCLDNTDCSGLTPICDNEKKCVECVAAADCTDLTAPLCDKNECVQCIGDQDCTDVTLPKCDNGVCAPN